MLGEWNQIAQASPNVHAGPVSHSKTRVIFSTEGHTMYEWKKPDTDSGHSTAHLWKRLWDRQGESKS